MDDQPELKAKNYFKVLLKKAQEAINIIVGNSEVYSEEDTEGDLKFDPSLMMKINVTFDKKFLPKEKVVKLNVRGHRFFQEIKRNIREINGLYVVYPREYQFQFDSYREEFEKRLIAELNEEYRLSLEKIHCFCEDEVSRRFQRKDLSHISTPYNLGKGELLIIAGGFANFNTEGVPLCTVNVDLTRKSPDMTNQTDKAEKADKAEKTDKTKADKTGKAGKGGKAGKTGKTTVIKKTYSAKYYGKFTPRAGAYFYIGGEWFHNLFIPEMYNPEAPRFFSFRIADDGKSLKFFSDPNGRGIDIRATVKTKTESDSERMIYTINPEYLHDTDIIDFELSISYDVKGHEESRFPAGTSPEPEDMTTKILREEPDTAPLYTLHTPLPPLPRENREIKKIPAPKVQVQSLVQEKKKTETDVPAVIPGDTPGPNGGEHIHPYLKSEMILLPCPKDNDISSYMMTIGDEKKNVTFYANSPDNEVSILAPEKEVYKTKIGEHVDYSIKLGSINYSISNTFLSSLDDKLLDLYFAWEFKTNVEERIVLESDFYIFGREPLDNIANATNMANGANMAKDSTGKGFEQLIRLNKSDEEFWRIGTSRDHALLLKAEKEPVHYFYNLSLSYPVYVIKAASLGEPPVFPLILDPVSGDEAKKKLAAFLAGIKKRFTDNPGERVNGSYLPKDLNHWANRATLENNDLVIIGNRVFKYIIPMVMESPLSPRIQQSILRRTASG